MQSSPTNLICRVKAAVAECRQEGTSKKGGQVPMFLMIPFEDADFEPGKEEPCVKNTVQTSTKEKSSKCTDDLKFPEMRNGILFTRCYCVHRNGLQDCCPLNQCQGKPKCLKKPWPSCLPAKYLQSRHPAQYPPSD